MLSSLIDAAPSTPHTRTPDRANSRVLASGVGLSRGGSGKEEGEGKGRRWRGKRGGGGIWQPHLAQNQASEPVANRMRAHLAAACKRLQDRTRHFAFFFLPLQGSRTLVAAKCGCVSVSVSASQLCIYSWCPLVVVVNSKMSSFRCADHHHPQRAFPHSKAPSLVPPPHPRPCRSSCHPPPPHHTFPPLSLFETLSYLCARPSKAMVMCMVHRAGQGTKEGVGERGRGRKRSYFAAFAATFSA